MNSLLTRPNFISRAALLLTAVVVAVAALLLVGGGSKPYVLKLEMSDASGIIPGSQVLLGGVPVGTVKSLSVVGDHVVADLQISRKDVRIGAGAKTSIVAANLLGLEYVALQPGNPLHPLPSGSVLPESATTLPTTLDQVIDVMNGPTRADFAVLLDEAGTAVAGRKGDISAILRQLPTSITTATKLLDQTVQDNHTLADLVARGDSFVARVDSQSGSLKRVVDASAGALNTLAARAGSLSQAVVGAPEALTTLTNFFVSGQSALTDIRPVVGEISQAAPPLRHLLGAVKPFTKAAVPTLNKAASVAPVLTKLADDATPTIKKAVPTVSTLNTIAQVAAPFSAWMGLSSQDLVAIFNGWPRALQFRDGISHIFNGDLYLDPTVVLNIADQGASAAQRKANLADIVNPSVLSTIKSLHPDIDATLGPVTQTLNTLTNKTKSTGSLIGSLAGTVTKTLTGSGSGSSSGTSTNPVSSLTGGLSSTIHKIASNVPTVAGGGKKSSGSSTTSSTTSTSSLSNLLGYLLGK